MRNRAKVVVADDDDLLQTLLDHKLSSAGYRVETVGDGQAALGRARLIMPQVIVLDAMMPIMDGFEALRRFKADPNLASIPVIMLTAMRRDTDIVTALQLGAADYLSKPFNPDELIARMSRIAPPFQDAA